MLSGSTSWTLVVSLWCSSFSICLGLVVNGAASFPSSIYLTSCSARRFLLFLVTSLSHFMHKALIQFSTSFKSTILALLRTLTF
jgi:hypothetical protein